MRHKLLALALLLALLPAPTALADDPDTTPILIPIYATLNQRMATRTGPSTAYTEDLGTHPQTTSIVVYQQAMGSGVPWGMVEFTYQGGLYRAYTGMKRIDAASAPPWEPEDPTWTTIVYSITPHYGPGEAYVPLSHTLPAGMIVAMYGSDLGYALIEYTAPDAPDKLIRSWVPMDALR